MTVLEALVREYRALSLRVEALEREHANRREKLLKLLKPGQEVAGVRCYRTRHLEGQPDALRASGDWDNLVREQIDPAKLALLVKLQPQSLADGRVRQWYVKRLLVLAKRDKARKGGGK